MLPFRAAAAVFAVALIGGAPAPDTDVAQQGVAALHAAFGVHHERAVHAKGIILTGRFEPSVEARGLSHAAIFARPSPIFVRFSDFTGLPDIPDPAGPASPRGMAIKFGGVDDASLDLVTHNFDGFPVRTAEEFATLINAIATSGPTAAKPTALDGFLAGHPAAANFLTKQHTPPESYATTAYFGVNAFEFDDGHGHKAAVRYRIVPAAGEHYLDDAAIRSRGPLYLQEEIAKRIAAGPVRFDWYAQVAAAGDAVDDPSHAWPGDRRRVRLGSFVIDRLSKDQAGDSKRLVFLPGNVPDGIAPLDPMIAVRTAAYPISFGERQ